MKSYDLIIVGGCSAGLAAAINAARNKPDAKIALLEKMPRVGKKLLATGNGKCNLTNLEAKNTDYRNSEFVEKVFERYSVKNTIDFFASLGLLTYSDQCARVYPKSNSATSVVDVLRFEIQRLGVDVICDFTAKKIEKRNGKFIVNGELTAPKVIIAAGGRSSPSQGSDGSGFILAESLGHSVTPLYPALAPLTVEDDIIKALKGVRVHDVGLTLAGSDVIKESRGEVLFADRGLSGIAAMELCAEAEKYISNVKIYPFTLIDFLPEMSENDIIDYLKEIRNINPYGLLDCLLIGALPKAVGIAICKAAKLYKNDKTLFELCIDDLTEIAKTVKNFRLKITGSRGFSSSQVTCGGVAVDEIDPRTMRSRLCDGLFFAGEIIDVDAGCGGYNLQWAWSSGLLAGESVTK